MDQLGSRLVQGKPLGLAVGVDAVVLHTVVVAGKLGVASGPGTSVVALAGMDAVMAS